MGRPLKDYSQAHRVLSLYDRLMCGEALRAADLAQEEGLSKRTFERDIAVLHQVLGDKLKSKDRLGQKIYIIPKPNLKPSVVKAQVLAYAVGLKAMQFFSGKTFTSESRGVMELLLQHSGIGGQKAEDRFKSKVFVTGVGNKRYKETPHLQAMLDGMMDALIAEKPISLTYAPQRNANGQQAAFTAYLLCFVLHRGALYFVVDVLDEDWAGARRRLVALDRVCSAEFSTRPVPAFPNDFVADEFFADAFGVYAGGDRMMIRLRVAADYVTYIKERKWHDAEQLVPRPDGDFELSFPVSGDVEVRDWILGMGPNVEVLEPADFRQSVQRRLSDTLALYR